MKVIRFLRSQEIGYSLLLAKQQQVQNEIQEYVFAVLKDNGGDITDPWKFDPRTREWCLSKDDNTPAV